MARSRESVRQNKAMQQILRGETPERRAIVGYDKKEVTKHGDKIDRLSDIMKEARMPWFCPKCDKVMKHNLDDKSWLLYNHCFDCQIKFETKLRIDGKYEEWKNKKINDNKLAWIKDQKQKIQEFRDQQIPNYLTQTRPDGYSVDKEKWSMDSKALKEKADEALEYLTNLEESID
tara:strand:+ start:465 stop:989 length:525 start_codon:yes stop_codon:yes gene_type:complete